MQQRESAKKAAASAAAAAAASGRHQLQAHLSQITPSIHRTQAPLSTTDVNSQHQLKHSVVAQTASWLDRANAILARKPVSSTLDYHDHNNVENQMEEVERLIHEGPLIQKTSAGLPKLLEGSTKETAQNSTVAKNQVGPATALLSSVESASSEQTRIPDSRDTQNRREDKQDRSGAATIFPFNDDSQEDDNRSGNSGDQIVESQAKRARKSLSTTSLSSMTSDAEALVGFLNSVRSESIRAAAALNSRRFSG